MKAKFQLLENVEVILFAIVTDRRENLIILNLLLHRTVSSEPSKQWLSPSQIKSFEMQ